MFLLFCDLAKLKFRDRKIIWNAGMPGSLEAIKLKGLKIILLSGLLALKLPGFF
jgi:hypothetical protein